MHLRGAFMAASAASPQRSPALQRLLRQRALPVIDTAPANWAMLSMTRQEAASYLAHPALGDACIHLAAVPPAGAEVEHVRVPVAVEALSVPGGACSGWASAQPGGVNADLSTRNHMRWLGSSGGQELQISGLLAKVMGGAPAAVVKPASVSYQVDWQAAVPCSAQSTQQHTCAWQVGSRRLGMRRCAVGLHRAALGATAHLRRLQTLLSGRSGRLVLTTCGGREQGGLGRSAEGLSSAAAWALLKVAAAELDSREWSLGGCSFDPLGSPERSRHATPPFTDAHGPAQQHGAWASPRLLPAEHPPSLLGVLSVLCLQCL